MFAMRVGIYGGSFDPIHLAHLQVAEAVSERLRLDRLFFVPAARSPFKESQLNAPASLRLQWIRMALVSHPSWEVDTCELERGGLSYTIETVRQYVRKFPESKLFYIIGMDNAAALPQWREAEELARSVEFAVVTRPGDSYSLPPKPFSCQVVNNVYSSISSRLIRERILAGQSVSEMMPAAVAESVLASGTYRK